MVPSISVLTLVTSALQNLGIRYVLVGSFASSIYGLYRATADIDILAEIKAEQVSPLYETLKDVFYVDEVGMRSAVSQRRSFNAIHFDSVFKVDIFIPQDDFSFAQLEHRQLRRLSPDCEDAVYVASAEDTILAKLRWYRSGNESSTTQWNDVLGVFAIMREGLDVGYLHMWAQQLGIDDLLQRAKDETKS